MQNINKKYIALFAVAGFLLTGFSPVFASSHREAPLISQDPVADSTDVYAFVSPNKPDTVTLLANYVPLEEPAGGPNFFKFGDDVLYTIKVDNDGDGREDISYEFRFKTKITNGDTFQQTTGPVTSLNDADLNMKQTYTVAKVTYDDKGKVVSRTVLGHDLPVAPSNVGVHSMPNYAALSAEAVKDVKDGASNLKVFAGQIDDPFFVELGGVFDLIAVRKPPGNKGGGVDGLAGYNTQTIALQVPIADVTLDHKMPEQQTGFDPAKPVAKNAVIGVWTAAYRHKRNVMSDDNDQELQQQLSDFQDQLNNPEGLNAHRRTVLLNKIHALEQKIKNQEAKADRENDWVQVSRLGEPLINEAVIPLEDKDYWNSVAPYTDAQFAHYYTNPELAVLTNKIFGIKVPPQGEPGSGKERDDLIAILLNGIPGLTRSTAQNTPALADELRLNVAIKPSATESSLGVLGGDLAGYPNGRRLADDSTDIELKSVAGVVYPIFHPSFTADPLAAQYGDGVDKNDKPFRTEFPYAALPMNGFDSRPHISQLILDKLNALSADVKAKVQDIIDLLS